MNCLWCHQDSCLDRPGFCRQCRVAMEDRDDSHRRLTRAALIYYHQSRAAADDHPVQQRALEDVRKEAETYLQDVDRVDRLQAGPALVDGYPCPVSRCCAACLVRLKDAPTPREFVRRQRQRTA